MTLADKHRLLRRQIKKHNLSQETITQMETFLVSIDQAYKESDKDLERLENMLELNSKELYNANQILKKDNREKSIEIAKAKKQLDHVLANISDIIIELDAGGHFTYLNPAWINFGEEDPAVSLGKNFMDFSAEIEFIKTEHLKAILDRDFKEDQFKTVFNRRNKKGDLLWWELSAQVLRDIESKISGAVVSLTDITALKETENELIEANTAKGKFLSTMSHEIRTPLNAVIAISNLLSMQDPKPSQLENISTLKFASRNLLNLINDILDYNKLITGNLVFQNKAFNLFEVLDGIFKSYKYLANEKSIDLKLNIGPHVQKFVKGDSLRLSQILSNLINNAIKFTKKGQVQLVVTQTLNEENFSQIKFEVIDTGIGIAEEKLEYIFERFTQAEDDTTKKYGGTGLGLAICKKLVTLQQSQIDVMSKIDEGTTFSFDLKFDKVDQKDIDDLRPQREKNLDLAGMRLLIVDDNPINLMVASQFFEKWNISYEEAESGAEAIQKFRDTPFDLILMDLQMPIQDGYSTAKEIRNLGINHSNIPIIALSASTSYEVMEKVKEAKMDDFLSKPFDPLDLYNTLEKHSKVSNLLAKQAIS